MSSTKGRVVNSWSFPEGCVMKAIATHLYDAGLRGAALERKFESILPHWKTFFDKPISTGAISQRADKARRYANENPETHPLIRQHWRRAGAIARRGVRVGKREFSRIARKEDRQAAAA